jgi:hypothetical protein
VTKENPETDKKNGKINAHGEFFSERAASDLRLKQPSFGEEILMCQNRLTATFG